MKKLKGKKIACFLALPHHTRFFTSMREDIKKAGGELIFIVTLGGFPYELDLARRNLSYRYFRDYMNEEVREKINASTASLLDDWAKRCFKWDGFNRWALFKQSWFFEAVVEEYFCVERFLEVEKPDIFIAHHECNRWGQVIGHLTQKQGIPFVTFQEGDYYNDYMGFVLHTEYSVSDLLWGEKTRSRLRDYLCSEDKMFLIGNTHIDNAIKSYADRKSVLEIKKELDIPSNKEVVLFLVDIKYGGIAREAVWKDLLRGLEQIDTETVLIFKWHPAVYKNAYDKIKKIFKDLYPSAILLYDFEPYKLLAISDYCVTLGKTTLAIEALAFGKPLFAFPTSDTKEDYYVQCGIAQTVFPPGNWLNLINTIEQGVPEEVQKNVSRYLMEYFYKLDGKSIERAIDCMSYILQVREEIKAKRQSKSIKKETAAPEVVQGRVSFIVPSGLDPLTLLATLTSLSEHVNYPDWEVVMIIHDEAAKEIMPGLSGDLRLVEVAEGSLGCLYNRGAGAATGEHFIFMSPGTLFLKGEGIRKALENGIVGVPIKDREMHPYCLGIGFDFNFSPYKITDESKQPEAVGGGLVAVSRDIFNDIGGFDEEIANHLVETDFSLTGKEIGKGIQYIKEALAVKYKQTYYGEDLTEALWKNRVRFFAKWIGKLPKDEDFQGFAKSLLTV